MSQLAGFIAGCIVLVVVAVVFIPFAIVWCTILLLAGLVSRPTDTGTKPSDDAPARRTDAASIMILNWNGRAFLEKLLPSLRAAVAHHGGDHEVIVIDNGSDDDSVEFVELEFPEVKLVRHSRNHMFVRGYNEAWDAATKDIVVLLNNDMVVDEGFLGPLLEGFEHPDTFAVSSQIFLADETARRVETGLTGGAMRQGVLKLWHDEVADHLTGLIPVLWAGGGSAAFDRRRLVSLGGFDALYDPFYFEDTGLSFEAWKRGWNVLFAPESKVVHAHQGSSNRLPPSFVGRIRRRNQHLFAWRHLTSWSHTVSSTLLLPLNVARLALGNRGSSLLARAKLEAVGLFLTFPRLVLTLRARIKNARLATRTDAEVFDLAHSRHRFECLTQPAPDPEDQLDILMLAARVPKRGVDGSWGLFELIRLLGQRHRITLCVLMDTQDDNGHVDILRPLVHRLEAWPIEREIGEMDLHHRMPVHLRRYYTSPKLRQRLAVLLRAERFDVVQIDYIEIASMVRDIIHGTRSVHIVHEPWFRAEQSRQIGGLFPRVLKQARFMQAINYESKLYSRFAVVSCFTSEDAELVARWVPNTRVEINPMGPNVENITPCPPSTGHTILSVGYFGHAPNIDAAIWFVHRVLPLVQAEVPDAMLRFAGGGATDAIVALKEHPGVELLGRVKDLFAEMENCTITIAPVREGGGLRTKVLESFAYGRTMVVTPLGASGIEVTDNVECRIATDEHAFAAAVVELLRNEDQRRAMENAARELVADHYTSEIHARRSESLYREICAGTSGEGVA
jgi:GT2 family glycosyltransferase/glycosyltransferase involved in cell wall biosynthesis